MPVLVALLLANWWIVLAVLLLVFYRITFRVFGIVIIRQDAVGIVNKKWKLLGSDK